MKITFVEIKQNDKIHWVAKRYCWPFTQYLISSYGNLYFHQTGVGYWPVQFETLEHAQSVVKEVFEKEEAALKARKKEKLSKISFDY